MRKLLQAASKLQKKKGDSYLGAVAMKSHLHLTLLHAASDCIEAMECTSLDLRVFCNQKPLDSAQHHAQGTTGRLSI
jgi:hypothetical protein